MGGDTLVTTVITIGAMLVVIITFAVLMLPLHPSLPGWAAWNEWREADERAERLLRAVLGDDGYRAFAEKGYIEVRSRLYPCRVYLIKRWPEKVTVVEKGRATHVLCAEPESFVPPADLVVVTKLMIEANEEEYLRIANKIP